MTIELNAALQCFKAQLSLSGILRKQGGYFCPLPLQMQIFDRMKFLPGLLLVQEDLVIHLYLWIPEGPDFFGQFWLS